ESPLRPRRALRTRPRARSRPAARDGSSPCGGGDVEVVGGVPAPLDDRRRELGVALCRGPAGAAAGPVVALVVAACDAGGVAEAVEVAPPVEVPPPVDAVVEPDLVLPPEHVFEVARLLGRPLPAARLRAAPSPATWVAANHVRCPQR